MFRFILRTVWRLVILLLGVTALGFIVTTLWPESNGRVAIFFTLLITYCIMAYLVVPSLMRLFHVFSRPDHIPLYVTTGDGHPSDPVTLALVVKNRDHLEKCMNKAGWFTAHPMTLKNGFHELISIVFNSYYPDSPLTTLYLFDRAHDIGFEIPTTDSGSARTRHHVRFWRLEEPVPGARNEAHYHFWQEKLQHIFSPKREIWIGAATEEHRAVDIQWRTGRLTHGGRHDADLERDFIIETLDAEDLIAKISDTDPGEQLRFRGQQLRTFYVTDGSIKVARIR